MGEGLKRARAATRRTRGMTDKQLVRFASEFREGILDRGSAFCMCFAVCAPLAPLLRMHGVECEVAEADLSNAPYAVANHFWIRLADGRALDPTADQFPEDRPDEEFPPQMPAVYLGTPLAFHAPTTETTP